jgi:hypothetical protein
MVRKLIGVVVSIVLLMTAIPPWRAGAQGADDVTWLLNQINTLRASLGLHPYALNAQLSAAAQQHSQYMADTCDISHMESNGSRPIDRARANGYTGNWISENIYSGSTPNPSGAWDFWMNSPIHYQGITHEVVNEIGIGAAYGSCGWYSYTLLFGHRDDVNAPPAPPVADDGDTGVAAAPPAYVPPPPSSTPTATIITFTPSPTWTLTPTWTPSPSPTDSPATVTPVIISAADEITTDAPVASPTGSALPPTAMPVRVPADDEATAIALAPSPTDTPSGTPTTAPIDTPTGTPPPTVLAPDQSATTTVTAALPATVIVPTPAPETANLPAGGDSGGFQARDLVPFALIGQAVLLVVAGFMYLRRTQ